MSRDVDIWTFWTNADGTQGRRGGYTAQEEAAMRPEAQDERDNEHDAEPYCDCNAIHAEEEFAWNECCVCGKAIRP